jgi:hypothetical protein
LLRLPPVGNQSTRALIAFGNLLWRGNGGVLPIFIYLRFNQIEISANGYFIPNLDTSDLLGILTE